MKFSAVILAGGKSRRMGQNKAQLKIENRSFLDIIASELSGFDELLVSVDDPAKHPEIALPMVGDVFPDCGPMGGIYSALKACRSDALVVVSCDLPLFERRASEYLLSLFSPEYDAAVFKTADGRAHPLCAVYRRSCAPVFEKHLALGNYRLMRALDELKVVYAEAGDFEKCLTNVNTENDYRALLEAPEQEKPDAADKS